MNSPRIRYQHTWLNQSEGLAFESRGMAYGDGLFETLLYQPSIQDFPLASYHRMRLVDGLQRLNIALDESVFETEWQVVLEACRAQESPLVVKLMVTRGIGGRGYVSPQSETEILWMLYPSAARPSFESVEIAVAHFRLGLQPQLAGLKHLNRLEQVMAQQEAENRGCAELLLLDMRGFAIESIRSNVFFWSEAEQSWITPALVMSGVAGVARAAFLDKAKDWGLNVRVRPIEDWPSMDAMFLINSVKGIQPVARCEAVPFQLCKSQALAQRWREEVMAWT